MTEDPNTIKPRDKDHNHSTLILINMSTTPIENNYHISKGVKTSIQVQLQKNVHSLVLLCIIVQNFKTMMKVDEVSSKVQ